ncbi:MAG TPA: hypothetical protein VHD87_12810 [Acidimicrobiales bacterium]|nr:hypothetical protein [Acidimicrobiales bacterium]
MADNTSICVPIDWVDACGGDHIAAIVLVQLNAWHHAPDTVRRAVRADGAWAVPTEADWYAATRLEESAVRRGLSALCHRGLALQGRWKLDGESVRHVRLANPADPATSILPAEQTTLLDNHPATKPRTAEDDARFAEAERLCNLFADLIEANGVKRPNVTTTWVSDMEKIIRIDGREPAKIERAIRWVQQDSFWASNVMCPAKLRERYSTLQLRAKNERGRGATHRPAAQADLAASYGRVKAS